MPSIYCPSCGSGLKYLYEKPKNCPSCSHSFAKPIVIEQEEESELIEANVSIPSIRHKNRIDKNILKNIKVEVQRSDVSSLRDIIGSSPGEKFERRSKGMSKEEYQRRIFEKKTNEIGE